MSDKERHAMERNRYFPVVDVNVSGWNYINFSKIYNIISVPDRREVEEEENKEDVDEESFLSGAAKALSSTAVGPKDSCTRCEGIVVLSYFH